MLSLIAVVLLGASDPHVPRPVLDSIPPEVPANLRRAVLIVSKTNAFRHVEHIPNSNAVVARIARRSGRRVFVTENGAVFSDDLLRRFSVIVLNSVSGRFLTPEQYGALERFVARGGGVVALHAAGDNSHSWDWYRSTIIGTRFIGHPGGADQIQRATVELAEPRHPLMKGIRTPWLPLDEWYSFRTNPAAGGMTVIARIDEKSYRPGPKLAMGDHPVIWINPHSKGRIVYSALGHLPESYDDPNHQRFLANAIRWAAR